MSSNEVLHALPQGWRHSTNYVNWEGYPYPYGYDAYVATHAHLPRRHGDCSQIDDCSTKMQRLCVGEGIASTVTNNIPMSASVHEEWRENNDASRTHGLDTYRIQAGAVPHGQKDLTHPGTHGLDMDCIQAAERAGVGPLDCLNVLQASVT